MIQTGIPFKSQFGHVLDFEDRFVIKFDLELFGGKNP